MLIICSGEDTFRSRQKAKELEAAYKAKHDPSGLSVEVCEPTQSPVAFLQARMGVGSLFAKRSFLRVDGLLKAKATEKAILKKLFSQPDEMTIVVDVEDDEITTKELDGLGDSPGLITYPFPLQKGAPFEKWLQDQAVFFGLTDKAVIKRVAALLDGNTWAAMNALMQISNGYPLDEFQKELDLTYQIIDLLLKQSPSRFELMAQNKDGSLLSLLLQQAIQAERVHSGDTAGIHPYVVSKLKGLPEVKTVLLKAIEAHMLVRQGFANEDEVEILF